MKKILITLSLLIGYTAISQSLSYLDYNNTKALCSNTGVFFQNEAIGMSSYEVPLNSNTHTIFSNSIWVTAENSSGTLYGSAAMYGGGSYDLFPGPIATDYNDPTHEMYDQLWTVTKAEIVNHINNYSDPGYTTPNSIENWPGNGNTSIGVAEQLAPYADINSNGIYEPSLGEYPCIKGDKATYAIMNDESGTRQVTSLPSMKIEVHIMFYQFSTNDYLNNTTFYEVSIYNRSNITYSNVKLGSFADFDIGGSIDDYIGSDSTRNIMYAYNGDSVDEGASGAIGYQTDPPAAGIKLLDHNASSIISFSRAGTGGAIIGVNTDPATGADYNSYLSGHLLDGSYMTNSSGADTKFTYNSLNSSGYTEINSSNPSGDRRAVMATTLSQLLPGENEKFNYAVLYKRTAQTDLFDPVLGLLSIADSVQVFYDNLNQDCGTLSVNLTGENVDFSIYPNPSIDIVNISINGEFAFKLIDISGKILESRNGQVNSSQIDVSNLTKGIYIVEITQYGKKSNKKIIIQ